MKKSAGFTLMELVVSISIIVLISALILFNYPKFNRTLALGRAAREVASALRVAQARAVQVRATGGEFPDNYGVRFNENSNQFILFSDNAACTGGLDKNYTTGCSVEESRVTTYTLGNGVFISQLENPDVNIKCGSGSNIYSSLNILFYRPDPKMEATCVYEGTVYDLAGYGPFRIHVSSSDGSDEKVVQVWLTGQISVKP